MLMMTGGEIKRGSCSFPERSSGYWFRTKEGVEYQINDEPVQRYITSRELHDKFMQCNGDQVISLFGYNSVELLKMIEAYERNNVKMTREEAVKKIMKCSKAQNFPRQWGEEWIEILEALGLLKFEEEKKDVPSPSSIIATIAGNDFINGQYYLFADKCVNALMKYGYKIVLDKK